MASAFAEWPERGHRSPGAGSATTLDRPQVLQSPCQLALPSRLMPSGQGQRLPAALLLAIDSEAKAAPEQSGSTFQEQAVCA